MQIGRNRILKGSTYSSAEKGPSPSCISISLSYHQYIELARTSVKNPGYECYSLRHWKRTIHAHINRHTTIKNACKKGRLEFACISLSNHISCLKILSCQWGHDSIQRYNLSAFGQVVLKRTAFLNSYCFEMWQKNNPENKIKATGT